MGLFERRAAGLLLCLLFLGAFASDVSAQVPQVSSPEVVVPQAPSSVSRPAVGVATSPTPIEKEDTATVPVSDPSPKPSTSTDSVENAASTAGESTKFGRAKTGAAEKSEDWQKQGAVGSSTFLDKVRRVAGVLALICFAIWGMGKFANKSSLERFGLPVAESSLIEIIEKKRLSPGRSIMLVRVGPKVLAVGVTEGGFQTLTELDGEALKRHQDEKSEVSRRVEESPSAAPTSPTDVARHYLSIIPGIGVKK